MSETQITESATVLEGEVIEPEIYAIANQKGGVGKTSTVLGLAGAFAAACQNVLIIDMDPQSNATESLLGDEADTLQLTTYDLMSRTKPGSAFDAIVATPWDYVDLIPSSEDLANMDSDGANDLIFRLVVSLQDVDLSAYAAVLIDCPPSLGKLLFAALLAARKLIVVTEARKYAVKGVTRLERTFQNVVATRANPDLTLHSIVVAKRKDTAEQNFRDAELRELYGDLVATTVIPEYTDLDTAHSAGISIYKHKGSKAIALQVAFTDLVAEITKEK